MKERSTLDSEKEVYKLKLDINELENIKKSSKEIKIVANAKITTNPVFFGKSENDNNQDYAISGFKVNGSKSAKIVESLPSNGTKIKIFKFGNNEESEKLEGVEFELLNEKGEVIAKKKTDKEGILVFENIIPRKIFCK